MNEHCCLEQDEMTSSSPKNSLFYIILASLILGSIVRIAYLWMYPVPVRDAFTYSEFIEEWIDSGVIPEEGGIPPLGLYLFKTASAFLGVGIIRSGTIVNVLIGLLIIATLGKIAYTIIPSSKIVSCICLVSATHPALVDYSCQATRENPYLLFCCLSVLFFILFLKRGYRLCYIVVASVFACASFLCRYEGFELLILAICLILFTRPATPRRRLNSIVLFSATYVLTFILISRLIDVPLSYYASYIKRYPEIGLLL